MAPLPPGLILLLPSARFFFVDDQRFSNRAVRKPFRTRALAEKKCLPA
jgi:hypothetical protein